MLDISILDRKNFEAEEFINSNTAKRERIDNDVYDPIVLANLNRTADLAQEIRQILNQLMIILSGYRCLRLNREVGSKDNSQHLKGEAIDFRCPNFTNNELIIRMLKDYGLVVDQCLMEGGWIHVSRTKFGANRNQFAYFMPDENGKRKIINLK
jgi:zinc D-Ala-D-Ala carboxypeptidase